MAGKERTKVTFACTKCGVTSPKWVGQCPGCKEWQTMEEATVQTAPRGAAARQGYAGGAQSGAVTLDSISSEPLQRMASGLSEFDRVLGGGLACGGSIVLGGNPGAGKSTLLLQAACHVAGSYRVLYCTGEESLGQIKDRAQRLSLPLSELLVAVETDVTAIAGMMERDHPAMVVVDSIQTMFHPEMESEPGGVGQVKTCAAFLNRTAKRLGIALLLVGHINKSESLAGPMALMHIVDAVLMLSSTDDARYRILRAEKNRLGSTSEIGVFAMTGTGLKVVENPSAIFLSRAIEDASGSIVTPLWEGTRPMLIEVQGLMDAGAAGHPRRVSVGLDDKRLSMLLAVLNKHGGIPVHDMDVYVNVVGGVRVTETSADLPVLLAAVSSLQNRILPPTTMAFGEVGLSGEVRPCPNGQDRIYEAAKLGFRCAVVPVANMPSKPITGMELVPVASISQALEWLSAQ